MSGFEPDTQIIIDFDKYCKTCIHKHLSSIDFPCDECLDHPASWNSERPKMYVSAEE